MATSGYHIGNLFILFRPKYYVMSEALTKQEFSLYSLFFLKFGKKAFDLDSVKWYFSRQMLKKLVFKLIKFGWLKTLGRGIYSCVSPENAISGIFSPAVENSLKKSGLSYCFAGTTAAEIWSNETYIQRSWEHSPFFVKVLEKDLMKWVYFLKSNGMTFFVETPRNVVGEFVVLIQCKSIEVDFHNGKPVEPLKDTVKFCEKNKDSFEFVLAYFSKKYNVKTSAKKEALIKVREAV